MSDNKPIEQQERLDEPAQVSRRQFLTSAVAMGAVLSAGGLGVLSDLARAEEKLDLKSTITNGIAWYNANQWGVEGKGWNDTASYYDRFPARAKTMVRSVIWDLSTNSSGMCIQFETDASTISVRWVLKNFRLAMPHMAATGVSGVDLYLEDQGQWHWVGCGQPDIFPRLEKQIVNGLEPTMKRFRLYLPLYNGVESVEIGVPMRSTFNAVQPRSDKSIVFYGSSIVQGAVASRPGMCHTALLGRRLNKPVINLGFSGQAQMEPEIARLLGELDPSIYVLDPVPNMSAALVDERYETFVRMVRTARPSTPIVLVEDRAYTNTPYIPAKQTQYAGTRASVQKAYKNLLAAGIEKLHFIPRDNLYGTDGEAAVDGSHPTDLGFWRMSDVMEPVLRSLL